MLRVKICGIREPAHAVVAAAAGADFIGLVFAPSRRQVTVEEGRRIAQALGEPHPLTPSPLGGEGVGPGRPALVGVFVNASADEINRTLEACGLDYLQLSGDEPPELLAEIVRPAIKAVRLRTAADLDQLESYAARGARLLLDSYEAGAYGGTGRTANWGLAAEAARRYEVVLAGGLTPANVGEAVARVRPWGVDVSSGVERDGVKDVALIEAFVQAARKT